MPLGKREYGVQGTHVGSFEGLGFVCFPRKARVERGTVFHSSQHP